MPAQSEFRCPECNETGYVRTSGTHPHPFSSKMDRNRECEYCGAKFVTIENVVCIVGRGDRAAIDAAERERARQRDLFDWADEANCEVVEVR